MKALICVDMQKDFISGALAVPDAEKVIGPLIERMAHADLIVLTADWHPEDHISFSDDPTYEDCSWPVHCVRNTLGALLDMRVVDAAVDSDKPVLRVEKGTESRFEAYSGFDGTVSNIINVEEYLREQIYDKSLENALRIFGVTEIEVGGLALDYCVAFTASDAEAKCFETTVVAEATRPVGFATGTRAVAKLIEQGVSFLFEL